MNRFQNPFIFSILLPLLLTISTETPLSTPDIPSRDPELIRELCDAEPSLYHHPNPEYQEPSTLEQSPVGSSAIAAPPAGTKLTFQSYRNSNWDIYLVNPDGSHEVRLTTYSDVDAYPALMPGCEKVAFASKISDSDFDIYVVDADGSNKSHLTYDDRDDIMPSWSPDGTQIAFQAYRNGNSDIFVMDARGIVETGLTWSDAYDGHPTWSPDGTQIVFSSNRTGGYELWVMDADGSNQRQLTFGATAFQPSWSPTGDKIAYANDGDGDGWLEIWQIQPDGSDPKQLYDDGTDMDRWSPSWSVDGKWLAYIETNWIQYQGQWYWMTSYMRLGELETGNQLSPVSDDRVWEVHWESLDLSSPGPCTVDVSDQQRSSSFLVAFSAEDVGPAGVETYDVQTRAFSGEWQDLVAGTTKSTGLYRGHEGWQVEFRCRACDAAGNVAEWANSSVFSTTIDAIAPWSRVSAPRCVYTSNHTSIQWDGGDLVSGIAGYDIFKREEPSDDWKLWHQDVTAATRVFTGTIGHTYYFRSQARDFFGHTEPWQPVPDVSVSFCSYAISVKVMDNRGNPIRDSVPNLSPNAFCTDGNSADGQTDFYLTEAGHYTLSVSAADYAILPTTALSISENITEALTLDLVLPPADDVVENGGFETGTLDGWSVRGNGAQIDVEQWHTGGCALKLSAPATSNTLTLTLPYAITQTIHISEAMQNPTLSFMYHISKSLASGVFLVQVTGTTTTTAFQATTATESWTHAWADLSAYAGQNITLALELTSSGETIWIDEVSVGSWKDSEKEAYSVYLPFIAGTRQLTAPGTDWPTLGYDVAHTGYNRQDPGASRYTLAWIAALPFPTGRELKQAVVADGILVASNDFIHGKGKSDAAIIALDAESGEEIWRRPFYDKNSLNPPSIAHGAVYFQQGNHSQDSYVFCLDLYTGAQYWQSEYQNQHDLHQAPLIVGDAVYVNGGYYGGLYGFNAGNGDLLWYQSLQQEGGWTPAYAHGNLYAQVRDYFSAHSTTTGKVLWHYDINYLGTATPVIWEQIAVMSQYGLSALDLDTHQILWSIIDSMGTLYYYMPAIAEDVVYVVKGNGAFDGGALEAHHIADGELSWSFVGDGQLTNAPAIAGNYVYVASDENTYVLNRTTHEVEWQTDHGGWLTIASGYLYIAQANNIIYAYRAQEP